MSGICIESPTLIATPPVPVDGQAFCCRLARALLDRADPAPAPWRRDVSAPSGDPVQGGMLMSVVQDFQPCGPGSRILVLGAGGQLGRAVVARLAQDGYRVRAFQRHPATMDPGPAVEMVLGDALDGAAVARAAAGQATVINAIGSGTIRRNTVESSTTAAVLAALRHAGPRRYIGISAGMVTSVSFAFDHLIRPLVFGNLYREHLAVERLIRESGLDWTIVRPTRLVNRPSRGYVETTGLRPDGPVNISRTDVAAFVAKEVCACQYLQQAVFLVSR